MHLVNLHFQNEQLPVSWQIKMWYYFILWWRNMIFKLWCVY